MSTKGQLTLPKPLRDALKLQPGSRVQAEVDERGRLVLVPALYEPEDLLRDRPPVERTLSIEEMNEIIGEAATR